VQTPDAPTLADLGVPFNADGYFVFIGPAGMPAEARSALADAISSIASDESTKAGGLIKKAFGGSATIKGAELDALLADGFANAGELIKAASE